MTLRAFAFAIVAGMVFCLPSESSAQPGILTITNPNKVQEFTVYNNSPILITAVIVTANSTDDAFSDPITTNFGWVPQILNAVSWEGPMGGSDVSWHEFTSVPWDAISLVNSLNAYGYFVPFDVLPGDDIMFHPGAIIPGEILGGFFVVPPVIAAIAAGLPAGGLANDPPASSRFLVAGVVDATVPHSLASIQSFLGETTVPEPGSLALSLVLTVCGVSITRRRRAS